MAACLGNCSVGMLMAKLFSFFSLDFNWKDGFLSTRESAYCKPSSQNGLKMGLSKTESCNGKLCFEDWLDCSNNAARAVDEHGKGRIIQEFVRGHSMLQHLNVFSLFHEYTRTAPLIPKRRPKQLVKVPGDSARHVRQSDDDVKNSA
uniref:PAP-associated domain-containing protein n=1 Tax=Cryptomonas curvata TaxID=233186 RepID=A0A7S0LUL1_9CRYP|mmetsp:Transcript_11189/g.23983  ORF Transcript_11189/g.23983 Transcript_11189/m.23983 type:complete len:147 (+) Transcript_11189:844-1284(+)